MAQELHYVINFPYQISANSATLIHLSLFRPDFSPAAGAVVSVLGTVVGQADPDGICIFSYRPGEGVEHTVEATLQDDQNQYRTRLSFKCNPRTAGFRSVGLTVFTDSAGYKPGDTIRVRLHAHELLGDFRALAGAQVNLLLVREQGPPPEQVVAVARLRTDPGGGAECGLAIPASVPAGNYLLWVEYEGGRECRRLLIQPFSAAGLALTHNLPPYLTSAQRRLDVRVALSCSDERRPESSELTLRAVGEGRELLRKQLSRRSADYSFVLSGDELAKIRDSLSPGSTFQWILEARDTTGNSGQVAQDVCLTERPFRGVVECDKDRYSAGERVDAMIRVLDLYGRPAVGVDVTATVAEIGLTRQSVTDEHGLARMRFAMPAGPATIVLTTPTMAVDLATQELRLTPARPMVSKGEPIVAADCRVRLEVTFDPAYKPVERVVHVDVTDSSGSLVAATMLPIHCENGTCRVDGVVAVAHWGTMLFNVYCAAMRTNAGDVSEARSGGNVGLITDVHRITMYPGPDAPGPLGTQTLATAEAALLTWPRVDRNWGVGQTDIASQEWGYHDPGPHDRPRVATLEEPGPVALPTPAAASRFAQIPGLPVITIGTGSPRNAEWGGSAATALADGPDQITRQRVSRAAEGRPAVPLAPLPAPARLTLARGVARRDAPWQIQCQLPAGVRGAWLSLSLPTVVPALETWEARLEKGVSTGVARLASRALGDRALLEWGQALGKPPEWCDTVRQRLAQSGAALVSAQARDGGWRSSRRERSSKPGSQLFVTAYALRALSEVRRVGQLWQRPSMEKAIQFIWERQHSSGLWTGQGSYYNEESSDSVDVPQSAQIFSILVQAYQALGGKPRPELQEVRFQLTRLLNQQAAEPAALAYTVEGLARWAAWSGKDLGLVRYLPALLELRRHGPWEPQWYNSYGGKVELNAFILEMLLTHFPGQHPLEVRETVRFLLSTREAWGVWHNEMGTVAAIRALVRAGAGLATEVRSRLVVAVAGREIANVEVDPEDPFLSAAQIGHLDLGPYLPKQGPLELQVTYDGSLEAAAVLEMSD